MKTAASSMKVVILGAPQVGKSAVTVRFLTRRFIGEYSSGTDSTYQTMFRYKDATLKVEIVDSAPQWDADEYRYLDADAFVIVYSINDLLSLKHARTILDHIHNNNNNSNNNENRKNRFNPPVLLLGNKADLHHLRQTSDDDVVKMTQSYRCRHCQISAAESYTAVDRPMQELLAEGLINKRLRVSQEKRRKSVFENVSKRIGNVFRRKSLEDMLPKKRLLPVTDTINRYSV